MDDLHGMTEAYVLGALDADDRERYESHLVTCEPCRAQTISYVPVVRALRRLPGVPPSRPPMRRTNYGWFAAAAAAIVAFVAGGYAANLRSRPVIEQLASICESVVAPAATVSLRGQAAAGNVYVSHDGKRTVVIVSGLASPPAGRVYQVWLNGARIVSPGTLNNGPWGLRMLVIPGNALGGIESVGVSSEVAPGSPHRTTPPLVRGIVHASSSTT